MQDHQRAPQCVATTDQSHRTPVVDDCSAPPFPGLHQTYSFQRSPDGTCLVTNNDNNTLRTYIVPADLLTNTILHTLKPYWSFKTPSPVLAYTIHPAYNLSNPNTTAVLSSIRDHPIQLTNTLGGGLHATYPLIHPQTEKYTTPHSLSFTQDGTQFITGSESLISVFDLSRNGQGPIARHATIPSRRKKIVGGGVGFKGIVSALAISHDGLLAAGTLTRRVGLYSDEGKGETIAVFSVASEEESTSANESVSGAGVTQCIWSPCGRYLYVVERKSDGAILYDIRVTGKRLGCLKGRKALTNQRLGVEMVGNAGGTNGHEIWAGGTDGVVRVWKDPHLREGFMAPDTEWKLHDDAVSSIIVHPKARVFATCSGQRPSITLDMGQMTPDIDTDLSSKPRDSQVQFDVDLDRHPSIPDMNSTLEDFQAHSSAHLHESCSTAISNTAVVSSSPDFEAHSNESFITAVSNPLMEDSRSHSDVYLGKTRIIIDSNPTIGDLEGQSDGQLGESCLTAVLNPNMEDWQGISNVRFNETYLTTGSLMKDSQGDDVVHLDDTYLTTNPTTKDSKGHLDANYNGIFPTVDSDPTIARQDYSLKIWTV